MSQESAEVLRRMYEAWDRGDPTLWVSSTTRTSSSTPAPASREEGRYLGREGVTKWIRTRSAAWTRGSSRTPAPRARVPNGKATQKTAWNALVYGRRPQPSRDRRADQPE